MIVSPVRILVDVMPVSPVELAGRKVLVTGVTGQVALPVAEALAEQSEVWGLARFAAPEARKRISELGVRPVAGDLALADGLGDVPRDFDYILNFAVVKSGDFDYDLAANAEGIGRLMAHCRDARAVLHCSSTAVYQYEGQKPRREDAPLGDNHRSMFPTYSISKIAAESVVRYAARQFGIPAIIARLSVPYGNNGGWPWLHLLLLKEGKPIEVHPERPNRYNPLHVDDYIEKIPLLLGAASPEAITVNFGGSVAVAIEEWCEYMGELTGLDPCFQDNPAAFGSLAIDTTLMHELIGETRVDWRDGIYRMVQALEPKLLK